MAVPKNDELFNPVLTALHQLGGSGRVDEIDEKVAEVLSLSESDVNKIHRGNRTQVSYRCAWARTYLKRYGVLENSERGVWSLTALGLKTKEVDPSQVKKAVRELDKKVIHAIDDEDDTGGPTGWEDEVLEVVKAISPDAFERLCQRLLRESGFTDVKVEGKSGDGGIDGRGIYKMNGLISTRVLFQSKRYKGSISSQQIREFKGTMSGRAEKGIFITTGTFTREAKKEATRDGSVPIDLVDGQDIAELLKNLRLGLNVKTVEEIEVNKDWFNSL